MPVTKKSSTPIALAAAAIFSVSPAARAQTLPGGAPQGPIVRSEAGFKLCEMKEFFALPDPITLEAMNGVIDKCRPLFLDCACHPEAQIRDGRAAFIIAPGKQPGLK